MNQIVNSTPGGRIWALVPVALLGVMLLGLGTLAYIAIDDPGFALEANYYDKAVRWDESRAEQRASEALGLSVSVAPLVRSTEGTSLIELSVLTKAGAPLAGATVSLEAFPNAFASRVQRFTLRESAPGVYVGKLVGAVPGLWELRCTVSRSGLDHHSVLRVDVSKAGA